MPSRTAATGWRACCGCTTSARCASRLQPCTPLRLCWRPMLGCLPGVRVHRHRHHGPAEKGQAGQLPARCACAWPPLSERPLLVPAPGLAGRTCAPCPAHVALPRPATLLHGAPGCVCVSRLGACSPAGLTLPCAPAVYHHASTFFPCWWAGINFAPGGGTPCPAALGPAHPCPRLLAGCSGAPPAVQHTQHTQAAASSANSAPEPVSGCLRLRSACGNPLTAAAGVRADVYFLCAMNSFVHVCMYAYYLAAGLGMRVGQPIKKSITLLQMVQFGLANAQARSALHLGQPARALRTGPCALPGPPTSVRSQQLLIQLMRYPPCLAAAPGACQQLPGLQGRTLGLSQRMLQTSSVHSSGIASQHRLVSSRPRRRCMAFSGRRGTGPAS